jgi:hypothetical protein
MGAKMRERQWRSGEEERKEERLGRLFGAPHDKYP